MANEDAVISRAKLKANFLDVIIEARRVLAHREFQLKESRDVRGMSHKAWVEAVVRDMHEHLNAAERFLQGYNERA